MPPAKDLPNILRGPGDYEVTTVVHSDTYPGIDPLRLNLQGTAVFITGGSRGLGRAMALSFARSGATHIAVGARSSLDTLAKDIRSAAELAGRPSPEFLPIQVDITDPLSVEKAVADVEKSFGMLHILINNAGILGKYGLIADSNIEEWKQVLDVNLHGPYMVTRAFVPLMLQTGGIRYIINVTSVGAFLTNPTLSAYQISKAALLKLSTLTNAEYSPQGITSFAIHPGNCPTDIMGGPQAIPPHHKHVFVETPELSGDSITYLVSQKREWLGGRYINCTWDLPELESKKDEVVAGDKLKTTLVF